VDIDKTADAGTDCFQVHYENLPLYSFSCDLFGHSSSEWKHPGGRDAEGKLLYSADRLCVPEERKKKGQAAKCLIGSAFAGQGHASSQLYNERNGQSANKGGAVRQPKKHNESLEVSCPVKKRQSRARTTIDKTGKVNEKGRMTSKKRKKL
jgi:hypothetical protein